MILGIVVIAIAAVIVITIVRLATKIAGQAEGAVAGVTQVREQTDALSGIPRINDYRRAVLHSARALRKVAVGKSTATASISAHTLWGISLIIGLVAALVVAGLLAALINAATRIDRAAGGCSTSRARLPATPPLSRNCRRPHRFSV